MKTGNFKIADVVLRNGILFDGTGAAPFEGDLAFDGGYITAIGRLEDWRGRREWDVTGLGVAPGFIDAHAHDDYAVIERPDMTSKISQGVTTVVVGNCGLSIAPLRFEAGKPPEPFNLLGGSDAFRFDTFADYAAAVDAVQPAVNVVALVGHTLLRVACMTDLQRPATPDELSEMAAILDRSLTEGASGLSSGVYYAPASSADACELETLAKVVANHGGIYATHIRDEYDGVVPALQEAFDVAGTTGANLIISHHKCAGMRNWGRSVETLAMIEEASLHQPVSMDCYPYTAGSSVLNPELADGHIRILINLSESHPACGGRYLDEIATEWGISQREAAVRLMPGYACYFQMREDDMRRILSHPLCVVGSDGLPNDRNPHPRLWGTFPRVLGLYAREHGLFSQSEAVAKMTGNTAQRFGINDRGRLEVNLAADITVFDPAGIIDQANFENPTQLAKGIVQVFVNGIHAWSAEERSTNRSGRFLHSGGVDQRRSGT